MTGAGRVLLYVVTGVEVPVYTSKRLFTRLDFQHNEGLESAKCSHTPGRYLFNSIGTTNRIIAVEVVP
jgi:hypothetical protein